MPKIRAHLLAGLAGLLPLEKLPVGQGARVGQVVGQPEHVRRLRELGFRDGERVEVVRAGRPCIVQLGSKRLCFRGGNAGRAGSTGDLAMRRLSELEVGESCRVVSVEGNDHIGRRLLEMGLTKGCSLTLVGTAPLGDPLELEVRGYRLSVRRSEAAHVEVEST